MIPMKNKMLVFSTGLAMFSMFFGSGNLVFPLLLGKFAEGHFGIASIGLLITGVLVPFLGILGMFLFQGDVKEFFGRLGKPAIFWLPLIALSLMGPFGVLARCITVAHGAFRLFMGEIPLWAFSVVACGIIFLLAVRKNRIVPILGMVLTPLLLLSLAAIAWFGIGGTPLPETSSVTAWTSLKEGLLQGYQIMDLLAAFFFSGFVLRHLREGNGGSQLGVFLKSGLLGAALLGAVYIVLVLLGAKFAPLLAGVPGEELLGVIAQKTLGPWAAPVVCTAIVLACFTTAVVLASLFADFFRKEVVKEKISSPLALGITLAIAFSISIKEFDGISKILSPIIQTIYPALITLTILNIGYKIWGWSQIRLPTALAVALKFITSWI